MITANPGKRSTYMNLLSRSDSMTRSLREHILGPCAGDDTIEASAVLSAFVVLKEENVLGPSVGDDGRPPLPTERTTSKDENILGPCVGDDGQECDRRLKRDVRRFLTLPNGLKLYSFRYWNDERTFIGVMAQDLLQNENFCHAVMQHKSGYYKVDLSAIGLDVAGSKEQFRDAGRRALAEASPPTS